MIWCGPKESLLQNQTVKVRLKDVWMRRAFLNKDANLCTPTLKSISGNFKCILKKNLLSTGYMNYNLLSTGYMNYLVIFSSHSFLSTSQLLVCSQDWIAFEELPGPPGIVS